MKRVLIIGNPGAGKSTLATRLGKILDLPVIHLDRYFWQPGWIQTESQKWRQKVLELISGERWIIDGNYRNTMDIRIPKADTIIWLDYSRSLCLWRAIKRIITGYGKNRPDMAEGCPEHLDFIFIKYIWDFKKNEKPLISPLIKKYFKGEKLYIMKSPEETTQFVAKLEKP